MRKKFSFIFPLAEAVKDPNRKSGLTTDPLEDLVVTGVAQLSDRRILDNISDRCGVVIESISYKGAEVSAILNIFGSLDQVFEACIKHLKHIFNAPGTSFRPIRLTQ